MLKVGKIQEVICPHIAEILKNDKVIARGYWRASSHFTEQYPDQSVTISSIQKLEGYDEKLAQKGFLNGELMFVHSEDDKISFQEFSLDGRLCYDSKTKEETIYWIDEEERPCMECGESVPVSGLQWTYDRYGNPFKRVCDKCFDKVEKQIQAWVLDESYAGEHLEDD